MYDEYEEIQQFLDEEADSYVLFEEVLEGHGFTFEEALNGADNYRSKFFSFLGKNGITSNNINVICVELAEKLQQNHNEEMLFLYTAMLTENGLLFDNITDSEQKILLWFDQSEKAEFLAEIITNEPVFRERIRETVNSIKSINNPRR